MSESYGSERVDWVGRLRDAGITVEEDPACILAGPRPGGHVFTVALLPGLPPDLVSDTCRESMIRFDRLANHGYEPGGWQLRSDGDYQLWLRLHDFGSDFPLQ